MATAAPKQLGITPPLSTALPTDAEKRATDALIEELTKENNFESRADTDKRYATLAESADPVYFEPVCLSLLISLLTYSFAQNRRPCISTEDHRRIRKASVQKTKSVRELH